MALRFVLGTQIQLPSASRAVCRQDGLHIVAKSQVGVDQFMKTMKKS